MDYPQYRTFLGEQYFKIISATEVLNVRTDRMVVAIGYSHNMPSHSVKQILRYDQCTKDEFWAQYNKVKQLTASFESK